MQTGQIYTFRLWDGTYHGYVIPLLGQFPFTIVPFDLNQWWEACGKNCEINPDHYPSSVGPVYVITMMCGTHFMVDGTYRSFHARRTGLKTWPAALFSVEHSEMAKIRTDEAEALHHGIMIGEATTPIAKFTFQQKP